MRAGSPPAPDPPVASRTAGASAAIRAVEPGEQRRDQRRRTRDAQRLAKVAAQGISAGARVSAALIAAVAAPRQQPECRQGDGVGASLVADQGSPAPARRSAPPASTDGNRPGPGDHPQPPALESRPRQSAAIVGQHELLGPPRLLRPAGRALRDPRGGRTRHSRNRTATGPGGAERRRRPPRWHGRVLPAPRHQPDRLGVRWPARPRPSTRPSGSASQATVAVPPPSTPSRAGGWLIALRLPCRPPHATRREPGRHGPQAAPWRPRIRYGPAPSPAPASAARRFARAVGRLRRRRRRRVLGESGGSGFGASRCRLEVDHPVAERLADPDHRPGRDHVEDHLRGRPRLEPGRAGQDLGPDQWGDLQVEPARPAGWAGCRRGRPWRRRASWPPTAPSTYGVRPDVAIPTTTSRALTPSARSSRGLDRGRPRPLRRHGSRRSATGDQSHDQLGRRAERRRTLRGVQDAEPARSPRPDIDQPAPLAESLGRPLDRPGHGRGFGPDGRHGPRSPRRS